MCAEKLIFLGASALKARLPRHLNCGRWGCQQFKEKKEISGDNEKCAISGFSAIFRRKMHSLASPEIHDHKDGGCTGTVGTREACRRFHAGIQRVGAWLSAGWCQRVPKTRQQNDHGARGGARDENIPLKSGSSVLADHPGAEVFRRTRAVITRCVSEVDLSGHPRLPPSYDGAYDRGFSGLEPLASKKVASATKADATSWSFHNEFESHRQRPVGRSLARIGPQPWQRGRRTSCDPPGPRSCSFGRRR